jgi:OOP family OmpA-OmpF porin
MGLNKCGVIGGGLGAGAGALVAEKAIAGAIPGLVVGAILGQMICDNDADGDGVANGIDQCPDTPKGVPVDANGCPDSDGDGVVDETDKCPNTPEGIMVDANGCPPDSDSDGVADYNDECPNTMPGIKVKDNGCAQCGQLLASVPSVNFDFNKFAIRNDAASILNQVAKAISNTETTVRIEGHTDGIGSDGYNIALSKKRASAVNDYLISQGVSAGNIADVIGKGKSSPIAPNNTEEGRSRNRRVELITDCTAQ